MRDPKQRPDLGVRNAMTRAVEADLSTLDTVYLAHLHHASSSRPRSSSEGPERLSFVQHGQALRTAKIAEAVCRVWPGEGVACPAKNDVGTRSQWSNRARREHNTLTVVGIDFSCAWLGIGRT